MLCSKQDAGASSVPSTGIQTVLGTWISFDRPVWKDGKLKAGTSKQLQKLLSYGSK